MNTFFKIIFAALVTTQFIGLSAQAFPEMIRFGYVNCTACHVSPSGGGVLNAYGRSLSAEKLSTWSYKGEEGFLHGAVDTSKVDDWLAIGGDYRGVQVHTDYTNKQTGVNTTAGRWINMQATLEAAIIQPKWAVDVALGQFNVMNRQHINEFKIAPAKYYLMYKPTEELSFRAGRFQPNFGINLPDHNLSTRTQLGIGSLSYRGGINIEDKYTAEANWLGENYNFQAGYYQIRREVSLNHDKGYTLTANRIFNETFKAGPQVLFEEGDLTKKTVVGATGLLGWTDKLVTLAEVDQIETTQKSNDNSTTGFVLLQRTSYELFKGFNILFLNDYNQSDKTIGSTKVYRLGPGVIWYPRPHFDFEVFYTQEHRESLKDPGVYAWFMTHYYF